MHRLLRGAPPPVLLDGCLRLQKTLETAIKCKIRIDLPGDGGSDRSILVRI
jgi:hypothetical protein